MAVFHHKKLFDKSPQLLSGNLQIIACAGSGKTDFVSERIAYQIYKGITLKPEPKQIKIVRDGYDPEKIKLHLEDNDGSRYAFLPITDLGFYNLAIARQSKKNYTDLLNAFIQRQKHVYLRIGLSRLYTHEKDGRSGFWIQVNGVYTFPEFMTEVRTYDSHTG